MQELCNQAKDPVSTHTILPRDTTIAANPENKPSHRSQLGGHLAEPSTALEGIHVWMIDA